MSTTLVCSFVCLDTHTCLNIHRSANAQSAGLHAPSLSPMRFITLILILPFFQEQMTPLPHTHTHTHTHTCTHTSASISIAPLPYPPSILLFSSCVLPPSLSSVPLDHLSKSYRTSHPAATRTSVCVCVCLRVCVGCVGVTFTSCTCKIH